MKNEKMKKNEYLEKESFLIKDLGNLEFFR